MEMIKSYTKVTDSSCVLIAIFIHSPRIQVLELAKVSIYTNSANGCLNFIFKNLFVVPPPELIQTSIDQSVCGNYVLKELLDKGHPAWYKVHFPLRCLWVGIIQVLGLEANGLNIPL